MKIQRQKLNEKHILILQSHSEKLKGKYKENFTTAIEFYKKEIELLSKKLETEKSNRLLSKVKFPVYSPGRYDEADVIDFS